MEFLNPEILKGIAAIIREFGFQTLCALCAIVLFIFTFRYFVKALTKKDCDFLAYVEKRDAQVNHIVETHNQTNLKTADAVGLLNQSVNGLKSSIDLRINREIRKDWKESEKDRIESEITLT